VYDPYLYDTVQPADGSKKLRYTCAGIATEYYYKVTVYKHEGWPVAAVGKGYAKVESMASVAMRK